MIFAKFKKEWQKHQDMPSFMKVPKNDGWTKTTLQRTEDGMSMGPKNCTREG